MGMQRNSELNLESSIRKPLRDETLVIPVHLREPRSDIRQADPVGCTVRIGSRDVREAMFHDVGTAIEHT